MEKPFPWSEDFAHYGERIGSGAALFGIGAGTDQQRMAQQAADNDDTKMTVSLAAEFGIDDMSGSGNNPYGTTSSAQYGDVTSMLVD